MKIAAYLRVSTEEQNTNLQRDAIASFCSFKGFHDVTWFIDQGESGSKISRPEFDRMMDLTRKNQYQAVIVWKFDRLSRSSIHLIQVMNELKELNVNFISIVEAIDTTSPMGKMIFGIFAVLAEFERDQLIMRTKAGMKAAKDRGAKIGKDPKLDMEQVLGLNECLNNGMKVNEIADHFGISRATAYRYIKKEGAKND